MMAGIEPDYEPCRKSDAPSHCPQPNIDTELFTLAHEYEHACSSAGRTGATEYKLYEAAAKHRESVTEEESKKLPLVLDRCRDRRAIAAPRARERTHLREVEAEVTLRCRR